MWKLLWRWTVMKSILAAHQDLIAFAPLPVSKVTTKARSAPTGESWAAICTGCSHLMRLAQNIWRALALRPPIGRMGPRLRLLWTRWPTMLRHILTWQGY